MSTTFVTTGVFAYSGFTKRLEFWRQTDTLEEAEALVPSVKQMFPTCYVHARKVGFGTWKLLASPDYLEGMKG